MSRASFVFSALMVVFAVLIFNSIGDLPAKVAVHFDANSAPDGWVSRKEYRIFALLFLIGLPLILFAVMAGLSRQTNGKGLIPNNDIGLLTKESSKPKGFCYSIRVGWGQ